MSEYKVGQWVVVGGAEDYWLRTAAKTLDGAKRCATKEYQVSVGGKIKVGQVASVGDEFRVEVVAVKHGYDAWMDV
mgnify:FL=1